MGKDQDTSVDPAPFQFRLVGRARVRVAGEERPISATKHLLLLARLARTSDRAATREQLSAFLWPGSPPENARASLRQALTRLRATLDGPVDPFEADPVRVALRHGAWETDLDETGDAGANLACGGTFLDGIQVREPEIEEWLEAERRTVAATVATRLRSAVHACVAAEGPESAIPLALRLVALDRLDEEDHRLLMRLYHQSGRRSQALGQFERLKAVLDKEIGAVPDRESRQLAEEIRRGAPPAPAAPVPGPAAHNGGSGAAQLHAYPAANGANGEAIMHPGAAATMPAGRPRSPPTLLSGLGGSTRAGAVTRGRAGRRRRIAATLALAAAAGVGLWWAKPWRAATPTASEARMTYPLPQVPSIAVLPFANMTSEGVPDVVIDGLVEEIIASLAKIPQIFVISGNSTFTYKGREVAAATVAEDLGVRYVMGGSVRGSEERVRITASLADALDGRQVWADTYDRAVGDVLALQSEIANRIVSELNVTLVSGELARLQESTTSDPDAYALFLKAQAAPRSTREDVLRRIRLYEESLARDPGFAAALAAWAVDLARMGRTGMADRDDVYPRAEEIAEAAIDADPGYSGGYLALSTLRRFQGDFERSLALVEEALAIAPNDADAVMYKGRMLRLLPGRAEEAIATIEQAMRLNPFYPPDYLSQLSWAYFAAERYPEAHQTALDYAKLRPNHDHAHWRLAMTYSILGEPEKAAEEVAATLRLNPSRTIAATLAASPYATSNAALMETEIAAMRAAGFPEE
ncbi:BTAD domain-containing putative transcriptional regulator [Acuticoccus kandeliae]|uniref:BTAD domain-containing putative transcriptional regulator n=1 Tax=Acuticoccus kandeliae TaxID=2073160 RepID=UPI00147539B8|nr:BTAD domain-containing putative transcriptional regulator [Acuticoccus kandeliae]